MPESETEADDYRPRRTVERRGVGVVHEPGPDVRFIESDAGTVHERPESDHPDREYDLDPKCSTHVPEGKVWSGIDADSAEAVATEYGKVNFCSRCFAISFKLGSMGRKARRERGSE